jgi:hypothetical protein
MTRISRILACEFSDTGLAALKQERIILVIWQDKKPPRSERVTADCEVRLVVWLVAQVNALSGRDQGLIRRILPPPGT